MKTIFSPCRKYRYTLVRSWSDLFAGGKGLCTFICLNPSTADEVDTDPTVRRCIKYAKDWGYDSFCMLNLFAFRATDPKVMLAEKDPVGPRNDHYLGEVASQSAMVVAGWGAHGRHLARAQYVRLLMRQYSVTLHYLSLTGSGEPGHPLYLPARLKPQPLSIMPKRVNYPETLTDVNGLHYRLVSQPEQVPDGTPGRGAVYESVPMNPDSQYTPDLGYVNGQSDVPIMESILRAPVQPPPE